MARAAAAAATNVAGTEPSAPARPRLAEATRTGAAGAVARTLNVPV
jgi:hypothetical protein